jgi:hypothetical protein
MILWLSRLYTLIDFNVALATPARDVFAAAQKAVTA